MIMKRFPALARISEWTFAFVTLLWFFIPLIMGGSGIVSPAVLPFQLAGGGVPDSVSLILACMGFWLIPALAIFKSVSYLWADRLPGFIRPGTTFSAVSSVAWSFLIMLAIGLHAVVFAGSATYFAERSVFTYIVFCIALVHNGISLGALVLVNSRKDPHYNEYLEFRRAGNVDSSGVMAVLKNRGIQRKLTLSFVGIIFAVIAILSAVMLEDFSRTLMRALTDNGKALADRTASIIKASVGDSIAIEDYLSIESKKNLTAAFPFKEVAYFRLDPKTGRYSIAASTRPERKGEVLDTDGKPVLAATFREESRINAIIFESPITLGGKTIGFTSVQYDKNVIYEPYFRTQLKTLLLAISFIYISVFFTYLFGRGIVFPILVLSMSVNSISKTLFAMIKGTSKVTPELLEYRDRVATKDEIKKLSTEIGNMATVIRGVLPYISASTLKHSERSAPTTEKKDLCFIFTDIRGFTTLCEGATPDEVVTMLNHFLEIQTQAIMNAGGDIDKFVGDEIMAMFDGDDKELKSCKAAMAIRKVMAEEREKSLKASKKAIEIGLGINSGPVVFGSVGAKRRMDFTSIGDTVNLAARLEGANKTYGTKSLITETVYQKVAGEYLCREIDLLTVKGKTQPVRIYELIQEKAVAGPKLVSMKEVFEEGLALYRGMRWKEAQKAFKSLEKDMRDETSSVFLRRIQLFQKDPPPEGWDGVFNLTVK